MWQLLIGLGATLGMIALSIVVPLLVGVVVLWIVSYVPIVGRRGQTPPRRLRDAPRGADATPDPPA
jgi:hypothetical protein